MSKVKGKKATRRSKRRKTVVASPASLPPQVPDVDAAASVSTDASLVPAKKAFWDVGKESVVYEKCMQVLALKATGLDHQTIADTLKIARQTVHNYCYIAGKNGWADTFASAKDQIEFAIMPKVVREIEAGLQDNAVHSTSGMKVRTQVALKVAEMTIAKTFEQASSAPQVNNVIAIRIEQVAGAGLEVREGNIGGVPAYIDGEAVVVEGSHE